LLLVWIFPIKVGHTQLILGFRQLLFDWCRAFFIFTSVNLSLQFAQLGTIDHSPLSGTCVRSAICHLHLTHQLVYAVRSQILPLLLSPSLMCLRAASAFTHH
jgi:hypothetical protein